MFEIMLIYSIKLSSYFHCYSLYKIRILTRITMRNITFKAAFGDEVKDVEISEVAGGGGIWHLLIDRYYYGQFAKRNGVWVLLEQHPRFYADDIRVLEEILNDFDKPL